MCLTSHACLPAAELSFERYRADSSSNSDGATSSAAGADAAAVAAAAGPLAALLGELHAAGVVRGAQMEQGYARVRAALQEEVRGEGGSKKQPASNVL